MYIRITLLVSEIIGLRQHVLLLNNNIVILNYFFTTNANCKFFVPMHHTPKALRFLFPPCHRKYIQNNMKPSFSAYRWVFVEKGVLIYGKALP